MWTLKAYYARESWFLLIILGLFWATYVDLQPSSIWLLDFIRTVDSVTFIPKIDC